MKKGIIAIGFVFGVIFLDGCQSKKEEAKIILANTKYSFGDVKRYDTLSYKFSFFNEGPDSLFILNAEGSCECTSIKWPLTPLVKGDTGYIEIQYVPDQVGFGNKTIVVEANTD